MNPSMYQFHKRRLQKLASLKPLFSQGYKFMKIMKSSEVAPENTTSREFKVATVKYKTGTVGSEKILFTRPIATEKTSLI